MYIEVPGVISESKLVVKSAVRTSEEVPGEVVCLRCTKDDRSSFTGDGVALSDVIGQEVR